MTNFDVQVVEHEETGKYRIMLVLQKDDMLDFRIVITAEQAEKLGVGLVDMAGTCRGKNIIIARS